MLLEGNIIYFTPFRFTDGSKPKNKYFIVLKTVNSSILLASLPSSKDYVPNISPENMDHGCLDIPDGCFNCYHFKQDKIITDCDWAFPLPTYIYGSEISQYTPQTLTNIYPIPAVDYEIKGKLLQSELDAIIKCLKESTSVRKKYQKLL
jgi:hypothetical protein